MKYPNTKRGGLMLALATIEEMVRTTKASVARFQTAGAFTMARSEAERVSAMSEVAAELSSLMRSLPPPVVAARGTR